MVVLSALVCATGLPSAARLLVRHGLRSAAWRVREGALRLVIAGLLCWRSPSSSCVSRDGAAVDGGKASGRLLGGGRGRPGRKRGWDGGGRSNGDNSDSLGGEETERRRAASSPGWDSGGDGEDCGFSMERLSGHAKKGTGSCRGAPAGGAITTAIDKEQLLCDVGSLLMDDRPEVRSFMTRWNDAFEAGWARVSA